MNAESNIEPNAVSRSSFTTTAETIRTTRCYACDRRLGKTPTLVDTRDAQLVYVGSECARLVRAAGEAGYQPPLGGPRLYPLATTTG